LRHCGESDPFEPREFGTEERWSERELNLCRRFSGYRAAWNLVRLDSLVKPQPPRVWFRATQKFVGMLCKLDGLYWLVTRVWCAELCAFRLAGCARKPSFVPVGLSQNSQRQKLFQIFPAVAYIICLLTLA
jgi:hypothetical protein